jgi:hypothetical protein
MVLQRFFTPCARPFDSEPDRLKRDNPKNEEVSQNCCSSSIKTTDTGLASP